MKSSIEGMVRNFLVESFGHRGATVELGSDVPLLERGILDSTAVLEIVSFFEQHLGIEVADEDVVPQNFGSIDRLVAYVGKKKDAG